MRDLHHDDLPDLPDPPPPHDTAMETFGMRWAEIEFKYAARGDEVAYRVSNAIYSIQINMQKRGGPRPGPAERDALLAELAKAHQQIMALFSSAEDRSFAALGFEATVDLICYWSALDEQRAQMRPRMDLHRAHQWARWLRNACHNLSILREAGHLDALVP